MQIEIISLALKKMDQRGITKEMVIETINEPEDILEGHGSRKIAQRIYKIESKEMLLRVVHEEKDDEKLVITAYLTSQVGKYRRN